MTYKFDAKVTTEQCCEWIRQWFEENGKGCNAVIGISGGKDSTVTAGLLVKALGKNRVIGVLMPNGEQADLDDAKAVCEFLGIRNYTMNIKSAYEAVLAQMNLQDDLVPSEQTRVNLAPRLRMSTLYAVSQTVNGRVVNTCNFSEDYVGYSTRYGDAAGDFAPLANLTVTEVLQMGDYLGLPSSLVHKTPSDGLCGKTDEDNLGFTYAELDKYIREGIEPETGKKQKIDAAHEKNLFKLQLMPSFHPDIKE